MDAAGSWTAHTTGTSVDLCGGAFVNASTGWAVGENGTILKTTTGGAVWTPQANGTTETLADVTFASTTNGWVASNGKVLATVIGQAVPGTRYWVATCAPYGGLFGIGHNCPLTDAPPLIHLAAIITGEPLVDFQLHVAVTPSPTK